MTSCLAGLPTARTSSSARTASARLRVGIPSCFSSLRRAARRRCCKCLARTSPVSHRTAIRSRTSKPRKSFARGSGKASNIPIQVHAEDIEARPDFKNVAQNIGGLGVSPSGVRAVIEARGNIFTVPAEHGSIRILTMDNSSVHELNPAWSPDGKWIAYLSDKTGEYEVYLRPQMGGDDIRVTTDGSMYRYGPTWSPDSKKLLYWDKMHRLWWISTEEKKPVQVDQGDYGDIADGSWAPDSQWIAYSKADRRGAGQLFLYSLDQKKTTKVSDGFYNDTNPVFDREG